ncbi:hypothetical protein JEQ12_001499 [Ovis aries]|uniref:Uncharacterized protein n=1 Tax=Ovis aries TaxID=9940 RepID=A0A836AJS1_SHEEP|nr:hypothetical protein JEQ12_001499 [Ovis aries]
MKSTVVSVCVGASWFQLPGCCHLPYPTEFPILMDIATATTAIAGIIKEEFEKRNWERGYCVYGVHHRGPDLISFTGDKFEIVHLKGQKDFEPTSINMNMDTHMDTHIGEDFPDGTVDKNPPADVEDTVLILGLAIFHMQQGSSAYGQQD